MQCCCRRENKNNASSGFETKNSLYPTPSTTASPQLLAMIKAALSTSGLSLSLQIPDQTHRQPASVYRCTFVVDPAERLPHE